MTQETATLIAASLAFAAALATAIISLWNGTRSRRRDALSEIAAHRVEWIERLRQSVSEYIAIANSINDNRASRTPKSDNELKIELVRKAAYINLLLNYSEGSHKELTDAINEAGRQSMSGKLESVNGRAHLVPITDACAKICKAEWARSKRQIIGHSA